MVGRTKSFSGIVKALPADTRMAQHAEQWRPPGGEQWRPLGGSNTASTQGALIDDISSAALFDDISNAPLSDDFS